MLSGAGITDATMDQVARLLPSLVTLNFYVTGTSITEASLLSLGTFCKRLGSCCMVGRFFFQELVCSARDNLFPALAYLRPVQSAPDHRPENQCLYTNPKDTAKRILKVVPCLQYFDFDFDIATAPDSDIDLHNAMCELMGPARHLY